MLSIATGRPRATSAPGADQPNTPPRPATPSRHRAPRTARTGPSPPPSPPPTRPADPATGNPAPAARRCPHQRGRPPATAAPGPLPTGHPPPAASPAPSPREPQAPPRSAGAHARRRGPATPPRSLRPHTPAAAAASPAAAHASPDTRRNDRGGAVTPRRSHAPGEPGPNPTDAAHPNSQGSQPARPSTATRRQPDPPLPSPTGASAHQHGPPATVLHDKTREGRCHVRQQDSPDPGTVTTPTTTADNTHKIKPSSATRLTSTAAIIGDRNDAQQTVCRPCRR